MQQNITIKYNDGSEDTYLVRPPDYAKWEMTTKKVISNFGGMWDILFVAHSAMKRDAGGKPTKPLEIQSVHLVQFRLLMAMMAILGN